MLHKPWLNISNETAVYTINQDLQAWSIGVYVIRLSYRTTTSQKPNQRQQGRVLRVSENQNLVSNINQHLVLGKETT